VKKKIAKQKKGRQATQQARIDKQRTRRTSYAPRANSQKNHLPETNILTLDKPQKLPENWTKDSLSKFLDDAEHNTMATYVNCRPQYQRLSDIDTVYRLMMDNLNQSSEFFAGFFLIRTHYSYLAANRLALGGQVAEAFMVLRGCLENALYGLLVAFDTTRQEIWLRRHDDEASKKRVKEEFTIRKVMDHLKEIDERTQTIAKKLYDQTVDYGGHPNERSVTTQIDVTTDGCRTNFSADVFNVGNIPHLACLKTAARIGVCCLDIFGHIFRSRYKILGIDVKLDQLRQGL